MSEARIPTATKVLPHALTQVGRFVVSPEQPHKPVTFRTPGYPAFLAVVYTIFGESHVAVVVVQTILSGITIICVYFLADRLWGRTAALLSILILSLDLPSLLYAQLLMTETLFTVLLTLSMGAGVMLGLARQGRARWALVSGLCLALATLVRPISYYLVVPLVVGWLVYGWVAGWRRKEVGIVIGLIALPSVVLVGGWRVRNYVVSGSSRFSQISNVTALYYRAAGVLARRDGVGFLQAKNRLKQAYPTEQNTALAPASTLEEYGRVGWGIVRQHPWLFVQDQLRGLMVVLFAPGTSTFIHHFSLHAGPSAPATASSRPARDIPTTERLLASPVRLIATVYSLAYLLLVYVAVLVALWRVFRVERRDLVVHVMLSGVIAYLPVLSAGPEAGSRFRVPIVPFLALYAGQAAALLTDRLGSRFRTRPGAPDTSL